MIGAGNFFVARLNARRAPMVRHGAALAQKLRALGRADDAVQTLAAGRGPMHRALFARFHFVEPQGAVQVGGDERREIELVRRRIPRRQRQSALDRGCSHEKHQQRAHAVIREPLPKLGQEQRCEPARMLVETEPVPRHRSAPSRHD